VVVTRRGLVVLAMAIALVAPLACGNAPTSTPSPPAVAPAATASGLLMPAAADAFLRTKPVGLVVLDVRTPEEFAAAHIDGAVNLDLNGATFEADIATLDPDAPYFVYCHSGHRSAQAVTVMQRHQFGSIYELQGGIAAWVAAGLQIVNG
jgi:phage shock protein E